MSSPEQPEFPAPRWLAPLAMTLAAWLVAFVVVTALLIAFGDELGSLPLAPRAALISGVLVALMVNLVMPALGAAVPRWVARPRWRRTAREQDSSPRVPLRDQGTAPTGTRRLVPMDSAARLEIERKFLVKRLPPDLGDGLPIEQGYLAIADDGVEVRVRRHGDERTLTVKSGPAHVRVEEEFEIDERRFDALWPLTSNRQISKTRHRVDVGTDAPADLDVYAGAHEGLVVAEFEFPSVEAGDAFDPPDWLGQDVTGDRRYANQWLALHGQPEPAAAQ